MNTFLLVLLILLSILFGMTIHELGHFTFAKIFKVNIKEFSIGIGPKIFQTKSKKGMLISFRLIPLMAYVMIDNLKIINLYNEILIEHEQEKSKIEEKVQKLREKNNFFSNKYADFCESNYLKNLIKFKYFATKKNDSILIDDVSIWKKLLILFGGVLFNLLAFFIFWIIQYFGFGYIANPFVEVGNSFLAMLKNMVFMGDGPGTIFGSIGSISGGDNAPITQLTTIQFFTIVFNFLTLFNLMLFFYNLLPIPPLDGYKIVIESLEKAFKFKVPNKVENIISFIGMALLFYVFISSIIADFI